MNVLQLVYVSISTAPITQALIEEICAQAQENNRRDEVTGLLLTRNGQFMQALEGPRNTVEDTFMRMVVDRRHHNVMVISRRMITRRDFGDWEMRHCVANEDCTAVFDKIEALIEEAPPASQTAFRKFKS